MLESGVMFEARIQTYWADSDPAGVVFFPHFFRFIEQAEEDMFRSIGVERHNVLLEHKVWFPRVEAFAKYLAPIRSGEAIRVRLTPLVKGGRSVRYDFEIVHDTNGDTLANGYLVIVCVDHANFKSTPIPDAIRQLLDKVS
jgi:YbgC/YbaW family acyl-CoA thioester hydrolase